MGLLIRRIVFNQLIAVIGSRFFAAYVFFVLLNDFHNHMIHERFKSLKSGELFLTNCNISAYAQSYSKEYDPTHTRKLLLHRRELKRLFGDVSKKGVTLIPLKIYFNERGIAKVSIGVCKHKKVADKRLELRERDIARETRRELKRS